MVWFFGPPCIGFVDARDTTKSSQLGLVCSMLDETAVCTLSNDSASNIKQEGFGLIGTQESHQHFFRAAKYVLGEICAVQLLNIAGSL